MSPGAQRGSSPLSNRYSESWSGLQLYRTVLSTLFVLECRRIPNVGVGNGGEHGAQRTSRAKDRETRLRGGHSCWTRVIYTATDGRVAPSISGDGGRNAEASLVGGGTWDETSSSTTGRHRTDTTDLWTRTGAEVQSGGLDPGKWQLDRALVGALRGVQVAPEVYITAAYRSVFRDEERQIAELLRGQDPGSEDFGAGGEEAVCSTPTIRKRQSAERGLGITTVL
ncbi:hypothetical protein B0H14DRAFT_3126851 [Mycena olivaceomarginata]|nr:hypothetical protein B0H14DRAFT_3126851 [Mycena olivaceomarginata]